MINYDHIDLLMLIILARADQLNPKLNSKLVIPPLR